MAEPLARAVPTLDLADRLYISLRHSGMGTAGIAAVLDVRRETISRWLNGKTPINTRTLQAWALATHVDPHWLITGATNPEGPLDSTEQAPAALAQSAERFTRNEEWHGSPPVAGLESPLEGLDLLLAA